MDPISFAIGVVSLTSIVSTCIEGFHIFKSIRAYDHDSKMIMLKVDIERALFIEWARSVGLLRKHHVDVKMFTPKTDELVHNILFEVKRLLDKAEALARKDGLIEGESWKSCFDSDKTTTGGWCHCDRHRTKHRHRPSSSPSPSRPGDGTGSGSGSGSGNGVAKAPFSRKFMWTIHTKAEFESLIEQLHYFIERLGQMVKSVSQRQMLLKDLRGLGADFSKLDLIEANGDEDKWSVQSSDGRNNNEYEDLSDVMTAFAGYGGRRQDDDDGRYHHHQTAHGGRTGHSHSRNRADGHSNSKSNSNSNSSPRPTRRSGGHRNDYDDGDPPPPYASSTSLSRRRSSPSSKPTTTTTTVYLLSDSGRGNRGGSRDSSRRPSSWVSGNSDFY